MNRRRLIAIVSVLSLVMMPQEVPPQAAESAPISNAFWPDGFEGAVSLTFDDGMPSQLEKAVPVLNRYGFKATFYVNPGQSVNWVQHASTWRQLAFDGHELSNHTDTHPCSCQSDFRHGGDYCTEKLGLSEIERAVDDAEEAIRRLTSQPPTKRSFAYPCYNSDVGTGLTRTSYVPEITKRYSAARIGHGPDNDPRTVDLSYVHALPADEGSVDDLIARVDNAMRDGRWTVIVFHGIGAEWNSVAIADFERLMAYLEGNRVRIWVAPFIDVADHIRAYREMAKTQATGK